jgi:hypothetical protein
MALGGCGSRLRGEIVVMQVSASVRCSEKMKTHGKPESEFRIVRD